MHDYKAMSVFVRVVEQGSMQAAAEKLAMTPSAVTQAIQKLEQQLEMKLLNRTTRKLSPTEAGKLFYQHAAQMQQSAENALKSIELLRSKPIGELNVACVTGLMDSLLINTFKSMLQANPDVYLNLHFADEVLDLVEQRIDIALRAGENTLKDNMIARHIYDFEWSIVAHRDYLAEHGTPSSLDELAALDWIRFSRERYSSFTLNNQQQHSEIFPNYRISCNTLYASRKLTLNGLGISIQPDLDVQPAIATGELVQLFPEWKLPTVPLYLVTLQRTQSEKVRLACEMITTYFANL